MLDQGQLKVGGFSPGPPGPPKWSLSVSRGLDTRSGWTEGGARMDPVRVSKFWPMCGDSERIFYPWKNSTVDFVSGLLRLCFTSMQGGV